MSKNVDSIRKTVVELYETQRGMIVKRYHKERDKIESQMRKRIVEILNIEDVGKVNVYVVSNKVEIDISFSTLITKDFICNVVSEIMPYIEQLNKLYVDYISDLERLDKWFSEALKSIIEGKEPPSFPELIFDRR